MQDEKWEELVNGETVIRSGMSINHGFVTANISMAFTEYLKDGGCTVIQGYVGFYLSEKDCYVPDVSIVCDRNKIKESGVYGAPDLVVEVLDPRTVKRDRCIKFQTYQKYGVREYWIVSHHAKTVEQYVLRDDIFVLHDVYAILHDLEPENMTEKEKADVRTSVKCCLFEGLEIELSDIFDSLIQFV